MKARANPRIAHSMAAPTATTSPRLAYRSALRSPGSSEASASLVASSLIQLTVESARWHDGGWSAGIRGELGGFPHHRAMVSVNDLLDEVRALREPIKENGLRRVQQCEQQERES